MSKKDQRELNMQDMRLYDFYVSAFMLGGTPVDHDEPDELALKAHFFAAQMLEWRYEYFDDYGDDEVREFIENPSEYLRNYKKTMAKLQLLQETGMEAEMSSMEEILQKKTPEKPNKKEAMGTAKYVGLRYPSGPIAKHKGGLGKSGTKYKLYGVKHVDDLPGISITSKVRGVKVDPHMYLVDFNEHKEGSPKYKWVSSSYFKGMRTLEEEEVRKKVSEPDYVEPDDDQRIKKRARIPKSFSDGIPHTVKHIGYRQYENATVEYIDALEKGKTYKVYDFMQRNYKIDMNEHNDEPPTYNYYKMRYFKPVKVMDPELCLKGVNDE